MKRKNDLLNKIRDKWRKRWKIPEENSKENKKKKKLERIIKVGNFKQPSTKKEAKSSRKTWKK